MIDFKNVTFRYPKTDPVILNELSFQINKNDLVSIVGPSGCGKSTILRLLNRLETPQSGDIFIQQQNLNEQANFCAYMPQKDLLLPWRNIFKNLALPLEIMRMPKKTQEEKIHKILDEIGLSETAYKHPNELSGGMRQRISLARTLLKGNEILLLDEPFSSLDYFTKIELREFLLNIQKKYHKTIVLITHDVDEAIFLSNKIFLIKEKPVSDIIVFENPGPEDKENIMQRLGEVKS